MNLAMLESEVLVFEVELLGWWERLRQDYD